MKKILFASSILGTVFFSSMSLAQTKTKVNVKPKTAATAVPAPAPTNPNTPYPVQNYSNPPLTGTPAPGAAVPVTGTVAAVPAANPPPNPWKLVYFSEYLGPRLSNFDLAKTQGPLPADTADYSTIFQSLKVGYGINDKVVLGVIARSDLSLNPDAVNRMVFYNMRVYGSWKHMIDTSIVDMQQVVEFEAPTTDASRKLGLLARFNLKNNWTIKTSLRNWYFSFTTLVSPRFYDTVTGSSTDLALGLFPWITLDLASDLQFVFEGSFDAGHKYQETFFDFNQGDPDYFHLGVMWSLNSHIQLNPAFRFFTTDLSPSKSVLYLSLTAAL